MRHLIFILSTFTLMSSACTHDTAHHHNHIHDSVHPHSFNSIWNTSEGLKQPESAYYHRTSGSIFVSNVNGGPLTKDYRGEIHVYDVNGRLKKKNWVKGLHAPKGLRAYGDTLYVADINTLIAIKISTGKIIKKYTAAGSKMLNDIAIDRTGRVYVSDTIGGKIFRINKNNVLTSWMSGKSLENPNGLFIKNNRLYVAAWGTGMAKDWSTKVPGNLYWIDLTTNQKHYVTKKPLGNLDGIEWSQKHGWLVSDWKAGKVFEISTTGNVETLVTGLKGAADIGWDEIKGLLIVPEMNSDKVHAYKL